MRWGRVADLSVCPSALQTRNQLDQVLRDSSGSCGSCNKVEEPRTTQTPCCQTRSKRMPSEREREQTKTKREKSEWEMKQVIEREN